MESVSEEAKQRAKQIVPDDERIIMIWKPTRQQAADAVYSDHCKHVANPCNWPCQLIGGPCIVACLRQQINRDMNTLVVLTDRKIYRQVDRQVSCTGCGAHVPSGEVDLFYVHSVWAGRHRGFDGQHIDSRSICDACCATPVAFVTLGLPPSHLLATYGATKRSPHHNKTFILVGDDREEATAATKLILETKSGTMRAGAASAPLVDAVAVGPGTQTMERSGDGPLEKIEKLKGLLDIGALTQEEFDEKKAALMAQV